MSNDSQRLERLPDHDSPAMDAPEPLGRVVSVAGSQVIVQFATELLSPHEDNSDVTVGTFLGIWNGRSLVIGALCEVSLGKAADGQSSPPESARWICSAS